MLAWQMRCAMRMNLSRSKPPVRFTIFRSNYKWDTVGTALFLGLFSWFSAGLSGIVNATIAFDQVVHNTLFIVGHFHQMALEGIGFAIIAATYAWLPEFTGKKLYSDSLGKWHIWLTFVGQMGASAFWMAQGIQGAPRRWAVLPDQYLTLTHISLGFLAVLVAAQLVFAYNLWTTLRRSPFDDPTAVRVHGGTQAD